MPNKELNQLLQMAIYREIQANKFYTEVAGRSSDQRVKELFEDLAAQEKEHENLLETFQQDPSIADKIKAPADYKVAEGEKLPDLDPDMKPVDAVKLAMKKEQQAADFYLWLADNSLSDDIKKMCKNLSEMELTHKIRLEEAFVNIAYPEVW